MSSLCSVSQSNNKHLTGIERRSRLVLLPPTYRPTLMFPANCRLQVSRNAKVILGETFVPTRDADGNPIMAGMEAIRGQQDDCKSLFTTIFFAWRS